MNRQLDKHHDHTRAVLYRIANHVLARAQYAATDRIGLRTTPGGFGTIPFGPDLERIRVSGGLLVREAGATTPTWTRTIAIDGSSLAELAAFAEVDLSGEFSAENDTPSVADVHELPPGEWRWLSCQCPRASVHGDGGTPRHGKPRGHQASAEGGIRTDGTGTGLASCASSSAMRCCSGRIAALIWSSVNRGVMYLGQFHAVARNSTVTAPSLRWFVAPSDSSSSGDGSGWWVACPYAFRRVRVG